MKKLFDMKIAVYLADQNPHRDRTLGVTNMTDALLCELMTVKSVQLMSIISKSSFYLKNTNHDLRLPWRTDCMVGRLVSDNLHPLFCRVDADVWFYPKGYLPWGLKPKAPCIGMVHDTILLWYFDHYKSERSALDYLYWLNLMKRSIAGFDLILTISESAKTQILELCQRFSITPPRIEVTYESVRYAHEQALFEKEDYVIHVASRAPHKKTAWLIENWVEAIQAGHELPLLKLVGNVPHSVTQLVEDSSRIEKLPFLDDEAYKQALGKARALIMPSEIEGFGLPAVEAYCLGTPACYVRGTAVDEVVDIPDSTGAFNLSDPSSFFTALDDVLALPSGTIAATRAHLHNKYAPKAFGKRVFDQMSQLIATS